MDGYIYTAPSHEAAKAHIVRRASISVCHYVPDPDAARAALQMLGLMAPGPAATPADRTTREVTVTHPEEIVR